MIGSTVSHYRILEKVGEGGMGVVYKAHDLKLNRDVALKFLPHALSTHEPERARFLQEAQAAAGLNHPNICTIHDIAQEGDDQFIVMEYVDGVTLREKIADGRGQMADCVAFAIQIGEALQEAHGKGIVHRDIKAENIMVNSKNQVKVMDFGLAKLKGSLKLTKTSSTVGTLAYMAPEQIQGGEVDARSDIFSFGVVLYEMLTGHMPFRGEHEVAMVYSIVNEESTPLQKYLPNAPSELIHIINRALEKDPEDRYQGVHDMVIDLRRLKKDTSRVSRSGDLSRRDAPSSEEFVPAKRTNRLLWSGVTLIVVVATTLVIYFLRPPRISLNPNYAIRTLYTATYQAGTFYANSPYFTYPGISGDGKWIGFSVIGENGFSDLYFMNVTWREPRKIPWGKGNPGAVNISPGGDMMLFGGIGQPLYLVSTNGGDPQQLTNDITAGGDWSADGERIEFLKGVALPSPRMEFWTMNKDGSDRKLVWFDPWPLGGGVRQSFGRSPDEESLVWVRSFAGGYSEIITRNLKTGAERQLTFDKKIADEPVWLSNGLIVFSSNRSGVNNIWAIPERGGEPQKITVGSGEQNGVYVSTDGKRMLVPEVSATSEIRISDLSGANVRTVKLDFYALPYFAVSEDQLRFAFIQSESPTMWGIYSTNQEGKNRVRLVSANHRPLFICFSPGGDRLAFVERREDSSSVSVVAADRPGIARTITLPNIPSGVVWINDQELAVFTTDRRSFICQIETGKLQRFFEDSTFAAPVLGGKYMCYQDFHRGKRGLVFVKLDSDGRRVGNETRVFATAYGTSADLCTWLYMKPNGEFWKKTLPEGREERIGTMPRLAGWDSRINNKGTRFFYKVDNVTLKLVLLENLFE